jgi:hypothetical protein
MSVVRDQEQGRLAILRGLISQTQLDWAWEQEFSRPDADLCQHLVELDLISADDADDIRLTLDDPPAESPSSLERVVDELASQFTDSDSSSAGLRSELESLSVNWEASSSTTRSRDDGDSGRRIVEGQTNIVGVIGADQIELDEMLAEVGVRALNSCSQGPIELSLRD